MPNITNPIGKAVSVSKHLNRSMFLSRQGAGPWFMACIMLNSAEFE